MRLSVGNAELASAPNFWMPPSPYWIPLPEVTAATTISLSIKSRADALANLPDPARW
jgi:hypothetical protein